jgi:hypothetical protein
MTDSRRQEIEILVDELGYATIDDIQDLNNCKAHVMAAIDALLKDAERLNYLMRIAEYKPEGWREAEWRIRFPVLPEHSFKSAIDVALSREER